MLRVYHSDRLERLAEELALHLQEPLESVLWPVRVGVQNPGIGHWLQRYLAGRDGGAMNLQCLDVGTWCQRLCEELLPGCHGPQPWDRMYLAWRLLGGFEEAAVAQPWAELDTTARHRFARRLARCYAGYAWQRPEWLRDWAEGAGEHWQARLWQRLDVEGERQSLIRQLEEAEGVAPSRSFWLGLEAPPLPPALLQALAGRISLHLLVWMPGSEASGPGAGRHTLRRGALAVEEQRWTQLRLLADESRACRASRPPGTSLLTILQADILADRPRERLAPRPVSPRDRSLQVHSCHSPMREVEVLYDQLLALFQADPTLKPADVVVLTPAGSSYGPLVEAVFGAAEGDRYIPFSVLDEPRPTGLHVVFLALLRLPAEDFATAPVLAILENEAVRRRFGFGLDDLPVIQRWVAAPGIRQVLATNPGAGLAREPDWQRRLESLLLGYSLGEGSQLPVNGVLPDPVVSEAEAAMLGRLQAFVKALLWLQTALAEALPVSDWRNRLEAVLARFFEPSINDQGGLALLRRALWQTASDAAAAGHQAPLPLAALLEHLRERLPGVLSETVLPGTGVGFCTAGLWLGVPSPVVCVLGASQPLTENASAGTLDLLAAERQRLAPQHQQQDFLQALLAARATFYVSYVGYSVHDNRALAVPAPVQALLDTLGAGFWVEGGGELLGQIRFEHPLTSISRRYFLRTDPLFSYAEELCAVSRIAGHGNAEPGSLVASELPPPGHDWNAVELARLAVFFRHPTRFLLRERLGLDLDENLPRVGLETSVLPGPPLAAALLEIYLQAPEPADLGAALRTAGLLPPGQLGEAALRLTREQVASFAERLREALAETVLNPLELETMVGGIQLVGRLQGVSPQGLLAFGAGPPGAGDYLDIWLKHLSLNLLAPSGVAPVSRWLDPGGGFSLQPVAEPLLILESLLGLYRDGLRHPLHLFPASALGFARAMRADSERLPEEVARRIWEAGEAQDPYLELAFRGEDPLDEEFVHLANRVFGPLLERLRERGG